MGNCCFPLQRPQNRTESYRRPPDAISVPRPCPALHASLSADPGVVDKLVTDMLSMIATYVDNTERSPMSLVQLQAIADREIGWIQVLRSIVDVIPLDDPFGMSAIAILLDDCPLPSKEAVVGVSRLFNLSARRALQPKLNVKMERNICVVLGCIAERLSGPNAVAAFTDNTMEYLIYFLIYCNEACLVMFAIIALEKFAATSENKLRIKERMKQEREHPLWALERHVDSSSMGWRQVGFCAQWALDNVFVIEGRELSYRRVDMDGINAMLNSNDASEYLKIASNGIEARCDSHSFESVRCTYEVNEGCWYYECEVITPGVMQIGWATKNSHFLNHEGFGIGDDLYSSSYDGCRRLLWHEAKPTVVTSVPKWRSGDILGCLLDVERREVVYSLNGVRICKEKKLFLSAKNGFYAAASFMAYQQCRFNFGSERFRYPPKDREFKSFNDHGKLSNEEKQVIPRRLVLEQLRATASGDDCCTLCCDQIASCALVPCKHRGFCSVCASQLAECPYCRSGIMNVILEEEESFGNNEETPGTSTDTSDE